MTRRTKLWVSVAILAAAAGAAIWLVAALPDDDDWTWDVLPERGPAWPSDGDGPGR